ETQSGQADRVILEEELAGAKLFRKAWCTKQWGEAHRKRWLVVMGQGKQRRIAPDVGSALGDRFAPELRADSIVVVSHFQWRETIVTDRAWLVAPEFSALTTSQFVVSHRAPRNLASSWGRAGKRGPLKTKTSFPEKEKRLRESGN